MSFRRSLISLAFLIFSAAQAQHLGHKLQVLSEDDARPVSNAFILADFRPEGKLLEGITDSEGRFYIAASGAFKLTVVSPSDSLKDFEGVFTGKDLEITVSLKSRNLSIDPVTVTGATGPRAVSDNPYLVRVIGKEKIARMAAQNLADLLLNEVNIQVGQDAVLGSSAIMQGIGGQDIKILINGIPVIGRVNGNVDVSQILLSNVERVEIIEGPMSVVYGTDALGGVINIITKNPVQKAFHTRVNTFNDVMGRPANTNIDFNISSKLGKKVPLSLNLGRHFFAGRDFNDNTRSFDWKPKEKLFGDIALFFNGKNSTHRFSSALFQEKLTDRSDAEYSLANVTGYNSIYSTLRLDNSLHSVFKIDQFSRFELQNAFNYYGRSKHTIKRNLVTGSEVPYRPEDQDTTLFTLFNSRGVYNYRNPAGKLGWTAGYDFARETAVGKRIPSELPGINDIAAFGSLEYSPNGEWQIRPSLRILHNSRFGQPILTGLFGSRLRMAPLIPSLQVKCKFSEHVSFRGSYAKGFRAPSLKELNFYFVDINHNIHGNDSLKAETSDNFVLSFDYRHKLTKDMGVVFSFSLFNNMIKNKINLALVDARTNYYTYINIGRFRSQGLNTNFEFNTAKSSFQFSGMFLTVYDLLNNIDTVDQKSYINGQVGLNYTRRFPEHRASVAFISRYTSPTIGYMQNYTRYRTAGFYLVDVIFHKSFKKFPLNISSGIKNVLGITTLNTTRRDLSSPHAEQGLNLNITPGRSFFLKLTYDLF